MEQIGALIMQKLSRQVTILIKAGRPGVKAEYLWGPGLRLLAKVKTPQGAGPVVGESMGSGMAAALGLRIAAALGAGAAAVLAQQVLVAQELVIAAVQELGSAAEQQEKGVEMAAAVAQGAAHGLSG